MSLVIDTIFWNGSNSAPCFFRVIWCVATSSEVIQKTILLPGQPVTVYFAYDLQVIALTKIHGLTETNRAKILTPKKERDKPRQKRN